MLIDPAVAVMSLASTSTAPSVLSIVMFAPALISGRDPSTLPMDDAKPHTPQQASRNMMSPTTNHRVIRVVAASCEELFAVREGLELKQNDDGLESRVL
jgi:hypothetical protein